MPWSYRKSVKVGPFRLNASKSGLGVSVGVKGFRVSTGPRGTYVRSSIPGTGISYSQKIGPPWAITPPTSSDGTQPFEETAHTGRFIDSSTEQLLAQLTEKSQQLRLAPILGAGVFTVALLAYVVHPLFGVLLLVIGLLSVWKYDQNQQAKRTTPLLYQLEEPTASRFATMQKAFRDLGTAKRVWRIVPKHPPIWSIPIGPYYLELRQAAHIVLGTPPLISTNILIPVIDAGAVRLFLCPDRILVREQGRYRAVPYEFVRLELIEHQFAETGAIPADSRIMGHTWERTRMDGGPDRRYSSNRQIPLVQYAVVHLTSSSGLELYLQVSNVDLARQFHANLRGIIHSLSAPAPAPAPHFSQTGYQSYASPAPRIGSTAHEIAQEGHQHLREGHPELAIEKFTASLQIEHYPVQRALSFCSLGLAHKALGHIDAAMEDFNAALRENPNCALAFEFRGGLFADKEEWRRAIQDL